MNICAFVGVLIKISFVLLCILCTRTTKYSLLPHISIPFNSTPPPQNGFLADLRSRYDIWLLHGSGYSCCCTVDCDTWFSEARGFRIFGRRYWPFLEHAINLLPCNVHTDSAETDRNTIWSLRFEPKLSQNYIQTWHYSRILNISF